MKWPFVSRGRYEEAVSARDRQISDLKDRLAESERDRKHWINQFAWRSTSIPVYPEMMPPKPAMAPGESKEQDPMQAEVPTGIEGARKRAGTSSPRAVLRELQHQRDRDFAMASGEIPPPAPPVAHKPIPVLTPDEKMVADRMAAVVEKRA